MPIVAVAGAVFAGGSIAAAGGIAAFAAANGVFAAISAVGAIASGIGTVTGNKTLTQIGGIAALAGGVGAFAQGRGWIPAGGEGGNPMAGNYVNQMDAASDAASSASLTSAPTRGVVNPTAKATADAVASSTAEPTAMITNTSSNQGGLMSSGPAGGASAIADSAGLSPLSAQSVNSLGTVKGVTLPAMNANLPTSTSKGVFDTLKDVGEFMNKNKDLASMGLNFVGGMFDEKKKAEAEQAKAAAELYGVRTQAERQQMINGNTVPDLTGMRFAPNVYNTPVPPVYTPPRGGLMNSTGR